MNRHQCLAVCAPGVEDLCLAELQGLGVRVRRGFRGGVEFSATDRQLYAANLWSRTANRIVVRVARFTASHFSDLEAAARDVDWSTWVPDGTTPTMRVTSTSSRLSHTGAVAERLSAVAGRGPGEGPLLVVRLIHDRVTMSIDSSGDPLYQRGWRHDAAKAPLRETLAAALLLVSGWDRTSPLIDPMCGSGTIAIEAALLAAGIAPGAGRRFAFQDWPSFAPGTWASVAAVPGAGPIPEIVASDRDQGAVGAARANAERAGVSASIDIRHAPMSALVPPEGGPGWLVCNPPYGHRVAGGGDLRDLYAAFGSVVRERLPGWRGTLLVADSRLARHSGLDLDERLRTTNGGIPVHAFSFTN